MCWYPSDLEEMLWNNGTSHFKFSLSTLSDLMERCVIFTPFVLLEIAPLIDKDVKGVNKILQNVSAKLSQASLLLSEKCKFKTKSTCGLGRMVLLLKRRNFRRRRRRRREQRGEIIDETFIWVGSNQWPTDHKSSTLPLDLQRKFFLN